MGSDWADANPDVCLQAVGSDTREFSRLAHTPAAIDAWARAVPQRCAGRPVAVCRDLTTGPLVDALRPYAVLRLCPGNPLTLAQYREAFPPAHAKDDPTDAELPRELLRTHRDQLKPLQPQSPAMRALEPLVEHRRRLVGDHVRLTNRLTRALTNDGPHVLPWFHDQAPPSSPPSPPTGRPSKPPSWRAAPPSSASAAPILGAPPTASTSASRPSRAPPHGAPMRALSLPLPSWFKLWSASSASPCQPSTPSTTPWRHTPSALLTSPGFTPCQVLVPSWLPASAPPSAHHANATPPLLRANKTPGLRRGPNAAATTPGATGAGSARPHGDN